ncbi:MAG: hypothetical protein AAF078_13805, partial [Planctomycetota bacterium]
MTATPVDNHSNKLRSILTSNPDLSEAQVGALIALHLDRPMPIEVQGDGTHISRVFMPDGSIQIIQSIPSLRVRHLARLSDIRSIVARLENPQRAELWIALDRVVLIPNAEEPREHFKLNLALSEEFILLAQSIDPTMLLDALDIGWRSCLTPFAFESALRKTLRYAMDDRPREALRQAVRSLNSGQSNRKQAQADRNIDRVGEDGEIAYTHDLTDEMSEQTFNIRLHAHRELADRSALNVMIGPDKGGKELQWELHVTSESA